MPRGVEAPSGVLEGVTQTISPEKEKASAEARAFFENHRDILTIYGEASGLKVEPSPEGLGTFGVDLEKGTVYVDPKYFFEKGYTEEKAFNSSLHEVEHVREMVEALREKGGGRTWQAHRERMKGSARLKLFDNVVDDVRMDRNILRRAPSQREVQFSLYRENLWPSSDFSQLPKHLQFAYSLFRESMLPEESCTVSDDVRIELKNLSKMKNSAGMSVVEYITHPEIPPSLRIALQTRILEPIYEKLFQEDVEEAKQQQKQAGSGRGQNGEGENQPGSGEEQGGESQSATSEPNPGQPQGTQTPQEGLPSAALPKSDSPESGLMPGSQNQEGLFQSLYQEYFDKNPDAALPEEVLDAAIKKYLETNPKPVETDQQKAEHAYALAQGVSVEDIRQYQRFWQTVESIENPETGEVVVAELRELFRQIISERISKKRKPKLPVSEGEILAHPAEAVAAMKAGDEEPEVWETTQWKERSEKTFGKFELTTVFDRSGSMEESDGAGSIKKVEQQKAGMLMLEALSEFSEELADIRDDLREDLEVKTEAWAFGSQAEVELLKDLSSELSEKERIAVFKKLSTTPGNNTYDYLALESIEAGLTDEQRAQVASGDLRKIVMVLSDGDSADKTRMSASLARLRALGIVVVGVGITEKAKSVETVYAPEGKIAKKASDIAPTLAELLKNYLKA